MDAIDPVAGLSPQACTLCMECVDYCPKGIVRFGLKKASKRQPRPVDLSRRGLLAGIAAGAAIPGLAVAARLAGQPPVATGLLRPPGAADEKTFLDLCIRCGECLKVCPTNVLQPTFFEAGLEGLFAPRLRPGSSSSRAIASTIARFADRSAPAAPSRDLPKKPSTPGPSERRILTTRSAFPGPKRRPASVARRCVPRPTRPSRSSTRLRSRTRDGQQVEIQQPYVDRDLCVGCGICESCCTVVGTAGIRVQRNESPDPGTEFLLKKSH